jgi:hypothetical protein
VVASDTRESHTPTVPGLTCTIVISGELGAQFDDAFADLTLQHGSGTTELSGVLTDQAELHGVLSQLLDLGLEILSFSTHPGELPPG